LANLSLSFALTVTFIAVYITRMAWEIEHTDEFEEWWMTLTEGEKISITSGAELLEDRGPTLPRPYADTTSK
jgi:hypothetical protein